MIEEIKEFIAGCWRLIGTILGVIAIIALIVNYSSTIATSGDLDKVRVEVKETIQQLKKSIELDRDITRLNQINDSLIKARIQQRNYPKDKDIAEDVEQLKQDKIKLQQKIEQK